MNSFFHVKFYKAGANNLELNTEYHNTSETYVAYKSNSLS